MSNYTFTPAENADPVALAAFQVRLAKLKPECSRCGKTLTVAETKSDTGQCGDHDECVLRQCWRTASASGAHSYPKCRTLSGLDIAGYRAHKKFVAAKQARAEKADLARSA